jgi:hypothetical protein
LLTKRSEPLNPSTTLTTTLTVTGSTPPPSTTKFITRLTTVDIC